MERTEEHLGVVIRLSIKRGGEHGLQIAIRATGYQRCDTADSLEAVDAGDGQHGHGGADDVAALLRVAGVTLDREPDETIMTVPVENRTDHQALIAVISTLV